MNYIPSELIRKKRFGGAHTRDELKFLIQGYSQERIPDYQMAAWLMAVCWQGMNSEETAWLTQEMRDSGTVLDFHSLGRTVDKHSTGGVGDKTSLILAPLVAAAGIPVPMIAGRGLGHTGGTLDKLESIPGFSVRLTLAHFSKQLSQVGTAIIGQTESICPADRKLYSLRDVTGTIDSLPLICGSIMSKKLAAGIDCLVLDVKFGSGAFMKGLPQAEALGRALMDIGQHSGKVVRALLTRMDEPLGRFIGNALEVRECLDILDNQEPSYEGKSHDDTRTLTIELAAHMIELGGKAKSLDEARIKAEQLLRDGSAKRKFVEMCQAQGCAIGAHAHGDLRALLPTTTTHDILRAEETGYLNYENVEKIGMAAILLGAGRQFVNDSLDMAAGIEVFCVNGQAVKKGDPLFRLYASEPARLPLAKSVLAQSIQVSPQARTQTPLIAKVLI